MSPICTSLVIRGQFIIVVFKSISEKYYCFKWQPTPPILRPNHIKPPALSYCFITTVFIYKFEICTVIFPSYPKTNLGKKGQRNSTQTSLFKAGLIKLAALLPAGVCGANVGVCILCSHCSPARSVCEISQSNAKSWESRFFCLPLPLPSHSLPVFFSECVWLG